MIRAYHVIITAYGFWLPNDPRGSWSDWVRQWELVAYGKATKVSTRQSVAKQPHDWRQRLDAKKALRYPAVSFDGRQALAVGMGFKRAIAESGYVVHACSILPRHAHLVIARFGERKAEQMVAHLKGRATQQLFLDSDRRILDAVDYVQRNPVREGKPPQRWSFVMPFVPHDPT